MKAISIKQIEEKIFSFIKNNRLIVNDDSILIGFSGGADSRFVLYFLNKFSKKYKIEIAVIHVNHQLRGKEAKRDENFCKDVAKRCGIPFFLRTVDVNAFAKKNKLSTEEAARFLRYSEFEKLASEKGFNKICTAHNMNDNSETVLLNIFKGTGTTGLAGIPAKRGKIIRPLLAVTREEIESYLGEKNIDFITDSTNSELKYLRNRIRHEILPIVKERINPKIDEALLKLSEIMKERNQIFEQIASEFRTKLITTTKEKIILRTDNLTERSLLLLSEIIRPELEKHFSFSPESQDIFKIKRLISAQKGTVIIFRNGLTAIKENGEIHFLINNNTSLTKKKSFRVGESVTIGNFVISAELNGRRKKGCEIISGKNLGKVFTIRKWENGDKFQPLGMQGMKKISDFLTDRKVPSQIKRDVLVLENNNEIIWVVGYQISDKVKVNNNKEKKVRLCVKKRN